MIMKRYFILLLTALSFVGNTSCSVDDGTNFHFTPLRIVSAELPESFNFGETYDIPVTYIRPDDCTFFNGFDVVQADNTTRNVVVIGSVLTDEENCTDLAEETTTSFSFSVRFTGTYLFRFWTGEDENGQQQYIEVEVPVNQGTTAKQ